MYAVKSKRFAICRAAPWPSRHAALVFSYADSDIMSHLLATCTTGTGLIIIPALCLETTPQQRARRRHTRLRVRPYSGFLHLAFIIACSLLRTTTLSHLPQPPPISTARYISHTQAW
ncbi:hypothetical protein K504DRAFT_10463 [Pleomassaria siparia CBS 279.74]|uniref:Uncharacterized protein n=1 Tax=Pleomassaria siparia CBS 279.74 TaxID=1314801 RepID=A0A6G1KPK5_9PLEO|nr:hypothetical protein K504DRAFT_10463 [Pleomassaria siparia CBS 279.74]